VKVGGPVIARATPADVADVARIAGESFSKPWEEGVFHEELGREFASLYVRRPSPAAPPVAFVSFWVVRDEVHVLYLATLPEHRRAGHARALLAFALGHARERGARHASLEVRSDNRAARSLYSALGFHPVARRPRYYVEDAADAVVMWRELERSSAGYEVVSSTASTSVTAAASRTPAAMPSRR
jgi:ribosomal-protein-alanine N-acetyltransferase